MNHKLLGIAAFIAVLTPGLSAASWDKNEGNLRRIFEGGQGQAIAAGADVQEAGHEEGKEEMLEELANQHRTSEKQYAPVPAIPVEGPPAGTEPTADVSVKKTSPVLSWFRDHYVPVSVGAIVTAVLIGSVVGAASGVGYAILGAVLAGMAAYAVSWVIGAALGVSPFFSNSSTLSVK